MPEGQMFYSVTYGKNLMGGYASQLDAKQRWMVISYIKNKQGKAQPVAAPAADSAAVKAVAAK
jgi:mono/diheme cytochrome c family protein